MNGGIPQGLSSDLLLQIKTIFAESFQMMFFIGSLFAIAAFLICWLMKKEVLTSQQEIIPDQAAQSL